MAGDVAKTLADTLLSVWKQALVEHRQSIEIGAARYHLVLSPSKRLRTVEFEFAGHRLTGIEQNPHTGSRWAELARQGKRIMQFSCAGRYIANVCEGKLLRYPAWNALGLPD